ncbi:MAG: DUF2254 domain-containing protein [Pseudomonadota bacterium]
MMYLLSLPQTALLKLRALLRRLWVRVAAMGLLAVAALGLSQLGQMWLPEEMLARQSGASADRLLSLIAQAMLAVTTFSLTVMVTVYRSSSSQFTPRVHQLITEDPVTQNTLATFIGAFVYAVVGIVLRETGAHGDDAAMVLFWMTVAVLALIVWSLIRWVLHLQSFGSLIDTTRQVERITDAQFRERLEAPCLGAVPLTGEVPEGLIVRAAQTGYIQHIYPELMQVCAAEREAEVWFRAAIGDFVSLNQPLVVITGDKDAEYWAAQVAEGIELGDARTYDQDPRFGLMIMAEIGSKALSPGINDPGTAIDVLGRTGRILSLYRDEEAMEGEITCPNLHVPPLVAWDLIDDGFGSIARDGAAIYEVQHRLLGILAALMQHPAEDLAQAARDHAEHWLERACAAMDDPRDAARLRAFAERNWR